MSEENNPTKTQEQKLVQIEEELLRLRARIQDVAENFGGQKLRIDRQVGTMDDLLKRFEAWKSIGNEMGEELKVLTNTVVPIGDRVQTHAEILTVHTNNIRIFKDFLSDLRELVEDATAGFEADESELDECSDEPKSEMDEQMERSMEELQNSINAAVSTRLDQHEERLVLHMQMLEALTAMAGDIKTFIVEVKEILGARLTPGDEPAPAAVPSNTGGMPT